MNQYQEALDEIERVKDKYVNNVDDFVVTEFEIMQKLVDKETPKKVVKREWIDVVVGKVKEYHCPSCNKTVDLVSEKYPNFYKCHYCCHCGQKLDWEVKE